MLFSKNLKEIPEKEIRLMRNQFPVDVFKNIEQNYLKWDSGKQ